MRVGIPHDGAHCFILRVSVVLIFLPLGLEINVFLLILCSFSFSKLLILSLLLPVLLNLSIFYVRSISAVFAPQALPHTSSSFRGLALYCFLQLYFSLYSLLNSSL